MISNQNTSQNGPEIFADVADYHDNRDGIKATVRVVYKDKEIHRHRFILSDARRRGKFINEALGKLSSVPPKLAEKYFAQLDEQIRDDEDLIRKTLDKDKNQEEDSTDRPKELTQEEREAAMRLLKDPALLFRINRIFDELHVAGEERNRLLLYLIITSRLMKAPISAIVKGETGRGKSFLVDTVCKLFPTPEAYRFLSGMSRQALLYWNPDLRHRMLVVAEAEGMDASTYNTRTLLSEHRLSYWTVEKNPTTGRLETRVVKKEGPTGLITTTTLPGVHPENETRLLSLAVDVSEQHTEEAKDAIADRYLDVGPEPDLEPYCDIQRVLDPVTKVRIPYAKFLAKHTPKTPGRILRDFNKLLTLIEASAVLHQHQRRHLENGIIEASLADYYIAKTVGEEALSLSLYGLHPNTMEIMKAIKFLVGKKANGGPLGSSVVSTDELMGHLGWGTESKLSRWAKPLKEYGWVEKDGRENYYRVGREIPFNRSFLPPVEAIAEEFPDLARDFQVIDPLTGKGIVLSETPTQEVSSDPDLCNLCIFDEADSAKVRE